MDFMSTASSQLPAGVSDELEREAVRQSMSSIDLQDAVLASKDDFVILHLLHWLDPARRVDFLGRVEPMIRSPIRLLNGIMTLLRADVDKVTCCEAAGIVVSLHRLIRRGGSDCAVVAWERDIVSLINTSSTRAASCCETRGALVGLLRVLSDDVDGFDRNVELLSPAVFEDIALDLEHASIDDLDVLQIDSFLTRCARTSIVPNAVLARLNVDFDDEALRRRLLCVLVCMTSDDVNTLDVANTKDLWQRALASSSISTRISVAILLLRSLDEPDLFSRYASDLVRTLNRAWPNRRRHVLVEILDRLLANATIHHLSHCLDLAVAPFVVLGNAPRGASLLFLTELFQQDMPAKETTTNVALLDYISGVTSPSMAQVCDELRRALGDEPTGTIVGLESRITCPITLECPRFPVLASDGVTYDLFSIVRHRRRNELSPVTRELLGTVLYYNRAAESVSIMPTTLYKLEPRTAHTERSSRSRRRWSIRI